MKQELTIVHLYPKEMSIYGDFGNVLTLAKRLEWRGIGAQIKQVGIGDKFDLRQADIIFAGGGQDRGQVAVGQDLLDRREQLLEAAENGVVMLTICGAYQLFGRRFVTLDGQEIPGIGLFGAETFGSTKRMIGNIVIESPWGRLVGFENHSGKTKLDATQEALGGVVKGYGNDGESGQEGAVSKNVFGTYLHGPILPKNPNLADHLLLLALKRKYATEVLTLLDDGLELAAAASATSRPQ